MKVIIINHFEGLDPRVINELRALTASGYEVEVLNWDRQGFYSKSGKNDLNLKVKVQWISVKAPRGSLKLIFALLPFYWKVFKILEQRDVDVVHCTHFILLPIALLVGKLKKAKVVYDAYEVYSVYFSEYIPYLGWLVRRMSELIENMLVAKIDCVLTINTVGGFLAERYKTYNGNVTVLYNVPDLDDNTNPIKLTELKQKYRDFRVIIYVGGIYKAKGLMELLGSLLIVRNSISNVKLVLIGSFHESCKDEALAYIKAHNLENNIEIISWIPYDEMNYYLKVAELGLALYQRARKHFYLVSKGTATKFFDYMKSGLPIIGPNFLEIGRIVEEEQCGILVDTTDIQQIAMAIKYILENPKEAKEMGEKGWRAIVEKYNWDIEKEKLLQAYKKMLKNSGVISKSVI